MNNSKKLNIQDLLADLHSNPTTNLSLKPSLAVASNGGPQSQFLQAVTNGSSKKIQKLTKTKHKQLLRKQNYKMTKQELDKWLPIIKINRQKQTLNLQPRDATSSGNNIGFFDTKPINQFHRNIQNKLKEMNISSGRQVMKQEQAMLAKMDPQIAKERLIQARKHRTAIFYEQQKNRRIAKIKSKLYRKIKKRQRVRAQAKKQENMGTAQRQQLAEKYAKIRIKERITQRHSTKNKHIQSLLRFNKNEKDSVQNSINEINQIRRKQLKKIDEDINVDLSEEYDDQNFREQAIKDLEEQINAAENQKPDQQLGAGKYGGLSDMRFMQIAKQKRKLQQTKQAKKLINKLAQSKDGYIDEQYLQSDNNQEQSQVESMEDANHKKQGVRKTYGKQIQSGNVVQKKTNKSVQDQLNKYLGNQNNQQLIQGINLQNLKQKYQPERVEIDLAKLIADNRQIYEGNNQAVLENIRQFQQDKLQQYQKEVEPQKKQLKGWGSWAGPGISQKKIDHKQQLAKKLRKIEELKRKRKDSSLAHVTINQSRNKNLGDYLVRNLPHNYGNADQFDFMQNEPIGPEWNTMNQFKDNIKPKVMTKVGQVIGAAQLPKKISKSSHNTGYGRQ